MVSPSLIRTLRSAALAALLLAPAVQANEGMRLQPAPINSHDLASLQNGAKLFVNYCLNCHSAGYMRYNRLQDIGLSEQQIRDNLIFTGVKVGELMQVAMDKKDGKEWFGTAPPDLTVITRSRSSGAGSGADWVYNYLRAFYRDDARPTGWNNLVFENVAMPHALWQLSGQSTLVKKEFERHEEAEAAFIAAKTLSRLDVINSRDAEGRTTTRYELHSIVPGPGAVSGGEYDRMVADLVNYLNYMGEPARLTRRQIGIYALFVLGLLFVFAFALKKAYWKDVH
jgi:ubiquinol-cytochrome c reductase cytochrome c1 subunit